MPRSASKRELRAAALALRKDVPVETRAAFAQSLAHEGAALAARLGARAVSLYWPIRDEPDVLPLLGALASAGVTTALPVTGVRGQPLVFRAWRPGDAQVEGPMRIPEPSLHQSVVEPDLLFLPLTVFDRHGNRIGYGAGYYDLTLQGLRAMKSITAVGVAYAAQEVARAPAEPHDQRLDFILTENGLMACKD